MATSLYSGQTGVSGVTGVTGFSGVSLTNVNQSDCDNVQVTIPMEEIKKISEGENRERIQDEVISIIAERIADDIMEDKEKEIELMTRNIDVSALLERIKDELTTQIKDKIIDDIK